MLSRETLAGCSPSCYCFFVRVFARFVSCCLCFCFIFIVIGFLAERFCGPSCSAAGDDLLRSCHKLRLHVQPSRFHQHRAESPYTLANNQYPGAKRAKWKLLRHILHPAHAQGRSAGPRTCYWAGATTLQAHGCQRQPENWEGQTSALKSTCFTMSAHRYQKQYSKMHSST